jgi:hypothetical protein
MSPMTCDRAQVRTRSTQTNFNHYPVVQPSATRPPFPVFLPPSAALNDSHLPDSPPPMPHTKFFSMFVWRLTPATTTLDDPYTALPPAKSRHRSEPPTPLNLDTDQSRHARLSSGAAGGWDLTEEYEGGKPGEEKRGEGTGVGSEGTSGDVLG